MSDPDALLREALVHAFESLTHIYGVAASHSDYADAVREIEGEATAATDAILTALAATPPASTFSVTDGGMARTQLREALSAWSDDEANRFIDAFERSLHAMPPANAERHVIGCLKDHDPAISPCGPFGPGSSSDD